MDIRTLLTVLLVLGGSLADYVQPTVKLNSCVGEVADFTITNMTAGGLIYIRTYLAFNILPTVDGDMRYTCPFVDCGIVWNVKYKLIIQRKVLYQSYNDVMTTYICMGDVTPLLSISSAGHELTDENATIAVFKPEVAMTFYSSGSELAAGSTIELGTSVDVSIEITNNFDNFFDLAVMVCSFSSIPLFEDFCPLHPDVFGTFTRVANGNLTNTFGMFKPTTTTGGAVQIIISCVLKVCMQTCTWDCGSNGGGTRRRRDSTNTARGNSRDTSDMSTPGSAGEVQENNIYVGKMFTVAAEEETASTEAPSIDRSCISLVPAVVLISILGTIFLASLAIPAYLLRKCMTQSASENTTTAPGNKVDANDNKVDAKYNKDDAKRDNDNKESNLFSLPTAEADNLSASAIGKEDDAQAGAAKMVVVPKHPDVVSCALDNGGYENDVETDEPVLYTNRERRRSSKIEVPKLLLQELVSKFAPESGLAKGLIIYKGIKDDNDRSGSCGRRQEYGRRSKQHGSTVKEMSRESSTNDD